MEVMKGKLEKYKGYRDSGVGWIGEIPENWKVESFKHILSERNEKNDPIRTKERLSLSIDKGVTLYSEKTTNLDRFKDDFTQYKLAHKGDLVLNSMNMIVGAVGVSNYFGCVSPVYYTFHGRVDAHYSTKFYEYLFKCRTVQGVLYSLGKGLMAIDRGDGKYNTLRLKVSRDDLRSLKMPFPPLPEQTAIAQFLDDKTAKIDQAIAQKERLIELLKERKQILIQELVTGKKVWDEATQSWIDSRTSSGVEMVDSGVEWIGKIPKGWEVKRFKHFTKILSGYSPEQVMFSENAELDYFKVDNLNDVDENYFLANSSWKIEQKRNVKVAPEGTLLIPKRGGAIGTNKIAISTIEGTFDTNVMGLLFDNRIVLTELIAVWIKLRNLITIADTTTIPQINNKHINPLEIALPDIKEQESILSYIKNKSNQIEVSINLQQTQIAKLKEYKSVLIDSAVTGKIRVPQLKE